MKIAEYRNPAVIDQILQHYRAIAVVGFSSKKNKAGYYVPAYLQQHGYRIIPVNPYLEVGLGQPAYPNLESIPEPVDLVLLFRRPEHIPPCVDSAIQIGAQAVWMQLGILNQPAADRAAAAGLLVVMDACMLVEHRARQG